MQCGYCTSGMIISAVALLAHTPHPSNDEIRSALAPHLPRAFRLKMLPAAAPGH
jgi:aerobic-type carbon monoxide dehydrogenase small subunit (CoxS/CutS family)